MKVGVVSLGEAGNLGDDLILAAVSRTVEMACPGSTVSFTGHGLRVNWATVRERVPLPRVMHATKPMTLMQRIVSVRSPLDDCDVVILGGGGLLQDSHNPVLPIQWLDLLPSRTPCIVVGVGVGPLSPLWNRVLPAWANSFTELWVRDSSSAAICAERFGWCAQVAGDFVSREFLTAIIRPNLRRSLQRRLGVAVRSWPGLDAAALARHIEVVVSQVGGSEVVFFVLEAKNGSGPDMDFTRRVSEYLSLKSAIEVYDGDIVNFVEGMVDVVAAVSMKLHSSVIWSHLGVPIYPISYAPKTASLFGIPFLGLEILREPAEVDESWHSNPSSEEVLRCWLSRSEWPSPEVTPTLYRRMWRLVSVVSDFCVSASARARHLSARHRH